MAFTVPAIYLRLSAPLRLLDAMQPSAYGIYLLHYIFIIWLQYVVYDRSVPRRQICDRVRRHALLELGPHRVAAENSLRGADDLSRHARQNGPSPLHDVRLYEGAFLSLGRRCLSSYRTVRACSMLACAGVCLPERIIKIVVPFAPGGGTDVVARTLAQEMAKDLGATVIIENKPGAGTIIGTQAVASQRARRLHAADGHVRQRGQSEPVRKTAL